MNDARTIRVALMLLGIFIAGGFCGWWIGRSAIQEPEPSLQLPPPGRRASTMAQKDLMLDEFTRQLKLTVAQRAQVEKIMDDWALEMQKANIDNLKAKEALSEKYSPLVRTNLTASQKKAFDSMTEQLDRRRRRAMQNQ